MLSPMHRRRRTSWGAAVVAVSLLGSVGCGDAASGDDPQDSVVAEIELGQLGAGRSFTPYDAAQPVEIHQGLQGGYHVFVDARLPGDEIEQCLVTLRMTRFDDDSPVATIQHLREPDLLVDEAGHGTLEDLIVFIPDPDSVVGTDVRLEATLELPGGAVSEDEVLLSLRRAY